MIHANVAASSCAKLAAVIGRDELGYGEMITANS
jgi:hypothetical protein